MVRFSSNHGTWLTTRKQLHREASGYKTSKPNFTTSVQLAVSLSASDNNHRPHHRDFKTSILQNLQSHALDRVTGRNKHEEILSPGVYFVR